MFVLVCFDIAGDKARRKVARALEDHGYRVQKSVFECPNLTEKRYLELKSRLEDLIDHTEDSLRYYILCRGCVARVEFAGQNLPVAGEKFRVV